LALDQADDEGHHDGQGHQALAQAQVVKGIHIIERALLGFDKQTKCLTCDWCV
jgi:hypothetical protein